MVLCLRRETDEEMSPVTRASKKKMTMGNIQVKKEKEEGNVETTARVKIVGNRVESHIEWPTTVFGYLEEDPRFVVHIYPQYWISHRSTVTIDPSIQLPGIKLEQLGDDAIFTESS